MRTEWNTPAIWIRRTFELPAAGAEPLSLWMHHDEDARVYLNGVLATTTSGYTTDYADFDIAPEAVATLKPGPNVIAIHCRQTGGGQYIDAGLVHLPPIQSGHRSWRPGAGGWPLPPGRLLETHPRRTLPGGRKRTGSGFSPTAGVAQLLFTLSRGGACLADAERLDKDKVLMSLIGLEKAADESTLGEWLRAQTPESVRALHRINAAFVDWSIQQGRGVLRPDSTSWQQPPFRCCGFHSLPKNRLDPPKPPLPTLHVAALELELRAPKQPPSPSLKIEELCKQA